MKSLQTTELSVRIAGFALAAMTSLALLQATVVSMTSQPHEVDLVKMDRVTISAAAVSRVSN